MAIREDQLNGRMATIIRECTAGINWKVTEENDNTLSSSDKRPDILITRQHPEPPIIVENEYSISRVEADSLNKLGEILRSERGGQTVSTVIGVHSPATLQSAADGDEAEERLRNGATLQYAVYSGNPDKYTRFPKAGFIRGTIRNLVEFIQPAAEPADLIEAAATTLSNGAVSVASNILSSRSVNPQVGGRIAEILRQPWPTAISNDLKQSQADQEARRQTATMAATIIINAFAYQQILEGYEGINGLNQVREEAGGNFLTKYAVIGEFNHILRVNFWPIFHVAKSLLLQIPAPVTDGYRGILESMASTANAIGTAARHNDVIGRVFQQLIADRKTLKTYYTTPPATTLMAYLAIPEDLDWGNRETVKGYTMADYACGSGGIMLAIYNRVRELHRLYGGDPDQLHRYMMEHCLTACDIMPAGLHLTASLLSSVAPNRQYDRTRCILFPFGGQRQTERSGRLVVGADGNPVKAMDSRGNPIVHLGSIGLLDLNSTRQQAVLPPDEEAALAARGSNGSITVPMSPLSQSLVAMNPPFTKPTKHAPFGSTDHVEPKNPAFAAFGTTDAEQKVMKRLERKLGKNTISDGNAGLGSTFTAIANNMVKPGGHIALILPTTAMTGGSYDAGKEQAYSWQRLRNLLYDNYDGIVVVSVAQPKKEDSAFSADSDYADCIVVARKIPDGGEPGHQSHFVNLKARPETNLEARETAHAIKAAIRAANQPGDQRDIKIGDETIGFVRLDAVERNRRWTTVRIANDTLVQRLRQLEQGNLRLPQTSTDLAIPFTTIGQIGQVGPLDRDITEANRGPFIKKEGYTSDQEYPMLWNHYPNEIKKRKGKDPQKKMVTRPDSHGEVKPGEDDQAVAMWQNATYLHINRRFQFNGNSTAATCTPQRALGGAMWPTVKMAAPEHEKVLCLWLNSTLGMAIYWLESDRGQDGRGGTTVTAIPDIPVLDVTRLSPEQLQAAVQIYEDLKDQELKPGNEAWADEVRKKLDERLFKEVLSLDDTAVENLDILRRQWCKEPTVTATKETGPTD